MNKNYTINYSTPQKIAGLVALVLALEPDIGIPHTIIKSPMIVPVGYSMAGSMAGQAHSDESVARPVTGLGSQARAGTNPFIMYPQQKSNPHSITLLFDYNFWAKYLIHSSLRPYINTLCETGKEIYKEMSLLYQKQQEKNIGLK